ncbi:MAG: substrate-binding domain-containing protein [Opitutaceae bacterium]|jgi:DNA-binding LacI/PurR family transcriptional regulator
MARPDTQTRLAVEIIRKRLEHGDHAGRFPGERQLARELGLSRPTVRKALRQLTTEGLLARGPTGRLSAETETTAEARRPLIAFLHSGRIGGESALWRDGVYDAAEARGAMVRSFSFSHYGDRVISSALDGFDGVFLLPLSAEEMPDPLVKRLISARTRVVVLDQDQTKSGLRSVMVFPFASGDKLLAHLRKLGHRRIDCINIQPPNPVIRARIAGWRAYLDENDLEGELLSCPESVGMLAEAYRLMLARLKTRRAPATAFLGTTVHAAIGAMRALHERGLRIGRDVSVCAINDEGLGPFLVPSLTALQTPPRDRYLAKAVDWMIGRVEWVKPSLVQPRAVPLFVGESTGPAPKQA